MKHTRDGNAKEGHEKHESKVLFQGENLGE